MTSVLTLCYMQLQLAILGALKVNHFGSHGPPKGQGFHFSFVNELDTLK